MFAGGHMVLRRKSFAPNVFFFSFPLSEGGRGSDGSSSSSISLIKAVFTELALFILFDDEGLGDFSSSSESDSFNESGAISIQVFFLFLKPDRTPLLFLVSFFFDNFFFFVFYFLQYPPL